MVVRRNPTTVNIKDNIGIVRPVGFEESARQSALVADAWATSTEKLAQGFKDVGNAITTAQAKGALQDFKVTTEDIEVIGEDGAPIIQTKIKIPEIRKFPFNPEVNEDYQRNVYIKLQQDVENIYIEKSAQIKADIMADGGDVEEYEMAMAPIEEQILAQLNNVPTLQNQMERQLRQYKVKDSIDIQGAQQKEEQLAINAQANRHIDILDQKVQQKIYAGQSIQPIIDEFKQFSQMYKTPEVRVQYQSQVSKYQAIEKFIKTFRKALSPSEFNDGSATGLDRVAYNSEALATFATSPVKSVELRLPDGGVQTVTREQFMQATSDMSIDTLDDMVGILNTNASNLKDNSDSTLTMNSLEEIAIEMRSGKMFSLDRKKDFNTIFKNPEHSDRLLKFYSGDSSAKFTLDYKDTQNYVSSLIMLKDALINENVEEQLLFSVKQLIRDDAALNTIIPQLATLKLNNGQIVNNPSDMFGAYMDVDGSGREAAQILNRAINEYYSKGAFTGGEFGVLIDKTINTGPLNYETIKNIKGTDTKPQLMSVATTFFRDEYGYSEAEIPTSLRERLIDDYFILRGPSNFNKKKFKSYLKQVRPILPAVFGPSDIQLTYDGGRGIVFYPINKDNLGKRLYKQMVQTIEDVVKEKGFFVEDGVQTERVKLGKNIMLRNIGLGAYTNDLENVQMKVVRYKDGQEIPYYDRNGNSVIINPFKLNAENARQERLMRDEEKNKK